MKRIAIAALFFVPGWLPQVAPAASENKPAESPKPLDEKKAVTAEVVVRGTLERDAAGPGRGGWPTYTLTVSQVFKTLKDVKIEVGQKLTVKTIKELNGAATLYLVFDKDQKLYRLQDPYGERGFSHVEKDQSALPDDSYKPFFDGRTFAGWEGNQNVFRIEDGAIVGGTLKANVPRNEYLCTTKTFRNFEVKLKFKLLGENVNAGVQFRSERVPKSNEMIGYQADMGQHYWGCLYDERRHKLLAGPTKEEQQKLLRRNEWNDYVIRAEGRHVQLWLNGQKTVDYTEPDASIPQEGVFGLQIHQSGPSEAWYKDIVIRELPEK